MKTIFAALALIASIHLQGQSIYGQWKTIDDETGEAKSIVEIYEESGKIYGKIIRLFRKPNEVQDPICNKCEDDRKDQRIVGMTILRDMILQDGYFKNGTICDPKNGKVYKCEFWLDGSDANKLQVRGYWGFLYRTQTWHRVQ